MRLPRKIPSSPQPTTANSQLDLGPPARSPWAWSLLRCLGLVGPQPGPGCRVMSCHAMPCHRAGVRVTAGGERRSSPTGGKRVKRRRSGVRTDASSLAIIARSTLFNIQTTHTHTPVWCGRCLPPPDFCSWDRPCHRSSGQACPRTDRGPA